MNQAMAKVMRRKPTNWSRFLVLTAIFVSLCAGAQAQVTIGTVKTVGAPGASSVDITGVNTTGSNTALVVAVCFNNNNFEIPDTVVLDPGGPSQTSLTWLDNAFGQTPASGTRDDGYCAMFGVKNPPSGTNFTVRATLCNPACTAPDPTVSDEGLFAGAWPLTGVNQTTPFGTAVGNQGLSSTASVTVGSNTGELVLAAVFSEAGTTTTALDTLDWLLNSVSGTQDDNGGQHKDGAATSTTLTWTINSPSDKWATIGVS
ncbi:hypothetical protein MYX75_13570, partial [Acidobacteria bacterium AH-259-A15]|nr:hypothetical protein [Acidobacteria bacterium AH-259-A15]